MNQISNTLIKKQYLVIIVALALAIGWGAFDAYAATDLQSQLDAAKQQLEALLKKSAPAPAPTPTPAPAPAPAKPSTNLQSQLDTAKTQLESLLKKATPAVTPAKAIEPAKP